MSTNALVAEFLARNAITLCPPCKKAYPWATDQDWNDAIRRACGTRLRSAEAPVERERVYHGTEHAQVFAYYLGDDEDTSDVSALDMAVYEQFKNNLAEDFEF